MKYLLTFVFLFFISINLYAQDYKAYLKANGTSWHMGELILDFEDHNYRITYSDINETGPKIKYFLQEENCLDKDFNHSKHGFYSNGPFMVSYIEADGDWVKEAYTICRKIVIRENNGLVLLPITNDKVLGHESYDPMDYVYYLRQ